MIPCDDVILRRLSDEDSDWAEGDDEINVAVKWLAQSERVRRLEKKLAASEDLSQGRLMTTDYWYKVAKASEPPKSP